MVTAAVEEAVGDAYFEGGVREGLVEGNGGEGGEDVSCDGWAN